MFWIIIGAVCDSTGWYFVSFIFAQWIYWWQDEQYVIKRLNCFYFVNFLPHSPWVQIKYTYVDNALYADTFTEYEVRAQEIIFYTTTAVTFVCAGWHVVVVIVFNNFDKLHLSMNGVSGNCLQYFLDRHSTHQML